MKKIMFNDKYGLTQAVLEGRKTMTRRIFNMPEYVYDWQKLSRFKVGEVVAVAQNYNEVFDEFATIVYLQDKPTPDNFKEFGEQSDVTLPKSMPGWNNKMFVKADLMPHRIRITNVRVERLQDITSEDALREGIYCDYANLQYSYPTEIGYCGQYPFGTARDAFAALIDKVSGKGTWESNPWVFVYEFELMI